MFRALQKKKVKECIIELWRLKYFSAAFKMLLRPFTSTTAVSKVVSIPRIKKVVFWIISKQNDFAELW